MKAYSRILFSVLSLILLIAALSCDYESYSIKEFDRWVMHLENKYKREMDKNGYSIHFVARPGNSVAIIVTTTPKTAQPRLEMIIEDAKQLVMHLAEDELKMQSILVTVEAKKEAPPVSF